MRVSRKQLDFLKHQVLSKTKNAKIYLFGSRADDAQKGGDIDILILSDKKLSFNEKVQIKYAFYEKFGEQKLDLVNFRFDENSNFKELALMEAIEL
jgi:predicted nucleotidyltransferase